MEWTTNMEGGGTLYFRDDGSYLYFEARRPYETAEPEGVYQVILQGMKGGQLLGSLTPWEGGWKLSRMVSRNTLETWGCLPVTKVICQKSYGLGMEASVEVGGEGNRLNGENDVKEKDLPVTRDKNETLSETSKSLVEVEVWEKLEEESMSGSQLLIGEETAVRQETERAHGKHIPPEEEQWVAVEEKKEGLEGFSLCSQPWTLVGDTGIATLLRHYKQVYLREDARGVTLGIPYFTDKEFPLTPLFCVASLRRERGQNFVLFSFTKEGKPTINPLA